MNRKEPVRMMLEYADIKYTEKEIDNGKDDVYPEVILNGKRQGQSMETLRSLGVRLGYYEAKDPRKSYNLETIIDNFLDLRTFMYMDKNDR